MNAFSKHDENVFSQIQFKDILQFCFVNIPIRSVDVLLNFDTISKCNQFVWYDNVLPLWCLPVTMRTCNTTRYGSSNFLLIKMLCYELFKESDRGNCFHYNFEHPNSDKIVASLTIG